MACSPRLQALDASWYSKTRSFEHARLPRYAIALLESLQFCAPDLRRLESLNETEWKRLLRFSDSSQLTLILGELCGHLLPDWVRARIDSNYRNSSKRFSRLNAALFEIADSLLLRNVEFVTLKGLGHAPSFTTDPVLRAQGDIDIWCRPNSVFDARDALLELGYFPCGKANGRHLPPMVRPTDWRWRGDYFAPDLPIPVDLHYTLWDEKDQCISIPPEQEFWDRRERILVDGRPLPVLCEADTLGFAALHLLMHLLGGDLRLQRAWEIAHFIHTRAYDEDFWQTWKQLHPPALRRLELIVFKLSSGWFGAKWPIVLSEEEQDLSADVKLWIERYALKPVEARFSPNKDELWLHLSLLGSRRDKIRIFTRRILPLRVLSERQHAGENDDARQPSIGRVLELRFRLSRFSHHCRTLLPTLGGALKWWWVRQELGRDFVIFQLSSALFDFGEFIFFLLFNLYLLERGFNEKFLGQVASLMTAGTIVGAIPTVALTRRIGLRSMLLIAVIGAPATAALRAIADTKISILASSLLSGIFMSVWAVSFAPAVSATTNERNRAFGFSLVTAMGIGLGSLAGVLGGQLPGLLQHSSLAPTSVEAKRIALLIGCGIAVLGAAPMALVKFENAPRAEKKSYPRGRFISMFLIALLIWSIGTGAFNPFFNAYFARRQHMTVGTIGVILSCSQLATVAAVLLAPLVLRKIGQIRGVAAMQAATAISLASLALGLPGMLTALMYISYMSFQYMSEPCLFNMLMTRVSPAERSGASALNFLVISIAGSLSALISGAAILRFGYPAVLCTAALLAITAASLFWTLVHEDR